MMESSMTQLSREFDLAWANLIEAYGDCGRGRISSVSLYERAFTLAVKRLIAAQDAAQPAQEQGK